MNKGLLLFHPAGIGDCVLDISNIYQLAYIISNDYKLYYVCNINSKPIIKCTDIENYAKVVYLDYPNKFSFSDIKKMFYIISNIDMIIVLAGMNLKKISNFKMLLPKRIKLFGAISNLPLQRVKEIMPSTKSFSDIVGPLDKHRVITNYRLFERINLLNNNFIIKGLNKEKLKNVPKNKMFMDLGFDYIIIHMGLVNNKSINKTLNMNSWAKLIENILKTFSMKIIIIGSKQEFYNIKMVTEKLGKSEHVLDFVGKTNLYESMYLILNSRFVIASDGAISHISASLGKDLICFFGPVNYIDVCPINTKGYIISKILECSPCYETENYYSCPFDRSCSNIDETHIIIDCIKEIFAGKKLLNKNKFGYTFNVIPTMDQLKSNLSSI